MFQASYFCLKRVNMNGLLANTQTLKVFLNRLCKSVRRRPEQRVYLHQKLRPNQTFFAAEDEVEKADN